jgi:1-acyl-sn-glycerol-3-phosphate acyltransferase
MLKHLQRFWYLLFQFTLQWIFIVMGGRVFGRHNIPKKGGAIIASNHQSYLDPTFLGANIYRPLHFLARKELFEANKLFGILISSVYAVPLERRKFNSEGLRETIKRLSDGNLFLVFPEGTRTRDGNIQPFKPGIIMLAMKSGVPIIPTRIKGAFEVWPKTRLLPKRISPITITFGKQIRLNPSQSSQEICNELYSQINKL